jgi:DNA-binding NarL/FixJ family response regulator
MKKPAARVNAIAFAEMISALSDGGTPKEIAEQTGLSLNTVYDYVNALHKRGQIHISGWVQDTAGKTRARNFKLGAKTDAKKTPVSKVEATRRWRQKRAARATFEALTQLGA